MNIFNAPTIQPNKSSAPAGAGNIFNAPSATMIYSSPHNIFNPPGTPNFYGGTPLPSNDPYQAAFNVQRRLELSGIDVPPPKPQGTKNLFLSALDYLDRPRNAIANIIKHSIESPDRPTLGSIGQAAMRGLKREEDVYFKEFLPEAQTKGGRFLRGATGFVGDILIDPLTYVTVGKAPLSKALGSKAIKSVAKNPALAGATNIIDDIAKFTGKNPLRRNIQITSDDLAEALTKAWDMRSLAEATVKTISHKRGQSARHALGGFTPYLKKLSPEQRLEFFTRVFGHRNIPLKFDESGIRMLFGELAPEVMTAMKGLNASQLYAIKVFEEISGQAVRDVKTITKASTWFTRKADYDKILRLASEEVSAVEKYRGALAYVEYINGLAEVIDAAGNVKYLSFMGKPILDVSAGLAPVGRILDKAYYAHPIITSTVDTLGKAFKPEYIRRSHADSPEQYRELVRASKLVTKYLRKETGIPHQALYNASKMYDDAFKTNTKLRQAAAYYVERNKDQYAQEAWNKILATLSTEELAQVIKAGKAHEHLMVAINMFDDALGIQYHSKKEYLYHVYRGKQLQAAIDPQISKQARVARRLSLEASQEYAQQFTSLAMAKEVGKLNPIDDIIAIDALRGLSSQRLALNKQLVQDLQKLTGVVAKRDSSAARKLGLQNVAIKKFNELAAHPEVIRQLNRLDSLFINDEALTSLLTFSDNITNFLKTMQTSANPSFIMRNAVGETLMNWLAGVTDLKVYKQAADVLRDVASSRVVTIGDTMLVNGYTFAKKTADGSILFMDETGKVIKQIFRTKENFVDVARRELIERGIVKSYRVGGKDMLASEIMQLFRDQGLGWSGISKGNLIKNMDDLIMEEITAKGGMARARNLLPWNAGKEVGDFIETWTRLSHLLGRLDAGWGIKAAVDDVRKFHVDYRFLTQFESGVMRRVMPFYTYMRHNTPIALRLLMEKPGFFGALGRLTAQGYEATGHPETPAYLKRGAAIPLGRDSDGNVIYLNWNLPLIDAGRVMFDMEDFFDENFFSMLHPVLKTPFEITGNRSMTLDIPVERFEGERRHLIPSSVPEKGYGIQVSKKWVDYPLQQMGFINVARNAAGFALDRARGVHHLRSHEDRVMRPEQFPLVASLLPRRSPRYTADAEMYKRRDQLQDYVKKQEQQGRYVMSGEAYQRLLRTGAGISVNMFDAPYPYRGRDDLMNLTGKHSALQLQNTGDTTVPTAELPRLTPEVRKNFGLW